MPRSTLSEVVPRTPGVDVGGKEAPRQQAALCLSSSEAQRCLHVT